MKFYKAVGSRLIMNQCDEILMKYYSFNRISKNDELNVQFVHFWHTAKRGQRVPFKQFENLIIKGKYVVHGY